MLDLTTEATIIEDSAARGEGSARPSDPTSVEAVASRLREARAATGLTQKEVAAKLSVSHRALWSWENAKASPREHMPAIAELYGRSSSWLWTGVESVERELALLREQVASLATAVTLTFEQIHRYTEEMNAVVEELRRDVRDARDESSRPRSR